MWLSQYNKKFLTPYSHEEYFFFVLCVVLFFARNINFFVFWVFFSRDSNEIMILTDEDRFEMPVCKRFS